MMLRKSSRGAISRHLIFVCGGILWSRGWSSIELMCLATFPAGDITPPAYRAAAKTSRFALVEQESEAAHTDTSRHAVPSGRRLETESKNSLRGNFFIVLACRE
jgi:uncharacterized membrane protein YccF (DUF307 family)